MKSKIVEAKDVTDEQVQWACAVIELKTKLDAAEAIINITMVALGQIAGIKGSPPIRVATMIAEKALLKARGPQRCEAYLRTLGLWEEG